MLGTSGVGLTPLGCEFERAANTVKCKERRRGLAFIYPRTLYD
jgi:hypothetical protein